MKIRNGVLIGGVMVMALSVCALSLSCRKNAPKLFAFADIYNLKKQKIGMAELQDAGTGVIIHLRAAGLPAGMHAFHIHEKGDFIPPDFKAAGGHFNPFAKEHGMKNPKGHHAGDMPNIEVKKDGTVDTRITDTSVTLKKGEKNSLLKDGGTSLIIHAKADDHVSDPAGNAGDRIAGGIIQEKK